MTMTEAESKANLHLIIDLNSEVTVEVYADGTPGIPTTWDDPGCPPEIEVLQVNLLKGSILDLMLAFDEIHWIANQRRKHSIAPWSAFMDLVEKAVAEHEAALIEVDLERRKEYEDLYRE